MTGTAVLVIKTMAACSGTVMICSPAPLIYQIFKKQSVGVASVIPLVTLFANCHTWAVYGYTIENWFPIFWIYLFGDVVATVFLAVYWRFADRRSYTNRAIMIMAGIMAVMTLYAVIGGYGYTNQSRDNMGSVTGIFADISAICLYAAPMEKLVQVLKHKSAVFINAHMVVAGLVNNCLWFTYGVLTHNWFIISPNIIFLSLNSFTLVLCVVFNPKSHPLPEDFYLRQDTENEAPSARTSKASLTPSSPAFEAMHSPLNSIQVK